MLTSFTVPSSQIHINLIREGKPQTSPFNCALSVRGFVSVADSGYPLGSGTPRFGRQATGRSVASSLTSRGLQTVSETQNQIRRIEASATHSVHRPDICQKKETRSRFLSLSLGSFSQLCEYNREEYGLKLANLLYYSSSEPSHGGPRL